MHINVYTKEEPESTYANEVLDGDETVSTLSLFCPFVKDGLILIKFLVSRWCGNSV
jgi:hypothetical protein